MERCVDKVDAADFPRKSKPLDSLSATVGKSATSPAILRAKDDISAEILKSKVLKRKRSSSLGNGSHPVEFRKKRSGKEVSLNSFISGSGKSKVRLGVAGLKANGSFSGVGKRKKPSSSIGASRALKNASHASNNGGNHFTLPSSKEETQFSTAGDLGSSNVLEGGIIISKRPRGVSRRKNFFHPINFDKEISSTSSRIKNSFDQLKSKLPVSQSHICQQKTKLIDLKEDDFTCSVSNCGTRNRSKVDSIKTTKRRSRGRKVDSSCLDNKDSLHKSLGVFPEDDEDNLEQNAARMLSSRFDPSCAGFSHCRVGSGNPTKESSFVLSHRTSNGSDAEIIDTGRVLRPRNYGNRGFVRKRRHFYEVCFNNMDPYWVVKQRIRVFWPLDKCWYFGLVKDYDPVTKMHHVKYDDRDEEWINLQKERFKLLLFPSELANKFNHDRSINEVKKKDKAGHKASMDEFSTRGLVETEPIISWLTRSTRQERPSALGIIKTQRRILTASKGFKPVGIPSTAPNLSSSLLNGSTEDESTENRVCSGSRKLPFVYSRRRIRKDRGYSGDLDMISDHAGSAWPISLFDSIADAKLAVEELCNSIIPKVLTNVTVSLRSPIWDRCKSMCGSDSFLLCRSFFLNHKLIHLFPLVRMEVGFMDNLGINLFLFEGCLSLAVVLLCHTFRENYFQKGSHRSSNENMTLKKIRINMLNLNNNGQRLYFLVDSFIERNSRWQYLENKLKQHCIRFNDVCPSNHSKTLSISCSRPLVQPLKKTAAIEDCQKNKDKSNFLSIEDSDLVSDITLENFGSSSFAHLRVDTDAISLRYSDLEKTIEANGGARSVGFNVGKSSSDKMFVRHRSLPGHMRSYNGSENLCCPFRDDLSSPEKSEGGCVSSSKISAQALRASRAEEQTIFRGAQGAHSESSLLWEMNEHAIRSPNATARRSLWHHNRQNFVSPILGPRSSLLSEDFIQSGFFSTTKKPRTQVSYPALSRSHDIRLKNRIHHRKGSLYKKHRKDLPRKATVGLESHRSFHQSLICHANVLITTGDRGWRELGAEVILDSDDQKDWKILIKLSGVTKYMYKAHQVLQPGIPNRYTHAMMWRGGKDWSLEFSDRNQWLIFKMMHGQCFNQNIRAASVKNIPIPGVRLIDDPKESTEVPFIRTSSKYYQLAGTEVDMALDPSHVLYDMDTDDEKWVLKFRDSLDSNDSAMLQMTDDMFERVMDMFERIAYVNQCDCLNDDEISEYMADFGSFDIVKAIHEFWHEKRKKNGMPLIRQYQPPLWERYHQQLKEWELTMLNFHYQATECQEKMTAAPEKLPEKPPMFAFCLKPRGLEANKGSKQRSHKKLMYAGHQSSFSREQDGRRLNASLAGDEKALVAIPSFEGSHSTQWLQSSSSFSPKLIRHFSKKIGLHHSPWDPSVMPFSYDESFKRNGVYRWNSDTSEWPNSKQFKPDGAQRQQQQQPDASEFRFRDSAQRASNVAKLKREKAQWLMHKADLALHKAVLAIMTADAINTSQNDSIGDDE